MAETTHLSAPSNRPLTLMRCNTQSLHARFGGTFEAQCLWGHPSAQTRPRPAHAATPQRVVRVRSPRAGARRQSVVDAALCRAARLRGALAGRQGQSTTTSPHTRGQTRCCSYGSKPPIHIASRSYALLLSPTRQC
eukprot:364208-Chlamydomonas_euryale.AAC.26